MLKTDNITVLRKGTDGEIFTRQKENLKLKSDFDEFKKQAIRRKKELKTEVEISLFRDLLPILDNFKFMLDKGEVENHQSNLDGLHLIYKELSQFIEKEEKEIEELRRKNSLAQDDDHRPTSSPTLNHKPRIKPPLSWNTIVENSEVHSEKTPGNIHKTRIKTNQLPQKVEDSGKSSDAYEPLFQSFFSLDLLQITFKRLLLFLAFGLLIGYLAFNLIN